MTTDPDTPDTIAGHLTEFEASAIVDFLAKRGIEAHMWGTQLASVYGQVAPRDCVQIVVRQSESERARRALDEFERIQGSSSV